MGQALLLLRLLPLVEEACQMIRADHPTGGKNPGPLLRCHGHRWPTADWTPGRLVGLVFCGGSPGWMARSQSAG